MICPHCGHGIDPIVPAGKPRGPLTPRQMQVLLFLRQSIQANGYAPSFDEIAAHFRFSSLATVYEHLDNLSRKGWIRRARNEARSITLLESV